MTALTFDSEKDKLRMVVENGVDASDSRVMTRTNEATQMILGAYHPQTFEPIIPVNGMMTAEILVEDEFFLLPPEMESVIFVEVISTNTTVSGGEVVGQGFYDIVNPFTYVDPSMAHDNPLEDHFLVDVSGVLRRKYRYPGFSNGMIRVVGPKSYVPITNGADTLIVQNVPALKRMIQSIEYSENNDAQNGQLYYDQSLTIILGEIKKHQMDPRWALKRKADYESDIATFAQGSKAWTRARIALEVPGAMALGREDLARLLDRAQLRMIEAGMFKGCMEEFNATVTDGFIYFPSRVQSVLAVSLEGEAVAIRSIFFQYLENGPGTYEPTCGGRLEDAGEVLFPSSGERRRKYRAHVGSSGSKLNAVCKLRWEIKAPDEQLTIRNLEANRLAVHAMILESQNQWDAAAVAMQTVLGPMGILQKELGEYLKGVKHTMPFAVGGGLSMADLGEYL